MVSHFPNPTPRWGWFALCIGLTASCGPKDALNENPADTATVASADADGGFEDGGIEEGGTEEGGVDDEVDDRRPGGHCAGVRGIFDCNLECWVDESRSYLGDGICDQGERGPDFDCPPLERDRGDCLESDDVAGTADTAPGGDSGTAGDAAGDDLDGGEGSGDDTGTSDLGDTEGSVGETEDGEGTASADGGAATSADTAGAESGAGDDDGSAGGEEDGTSSGGSGETSGAGTGECTDTEVADCDGRCWPAIEFHEAATNGECDDASTGGINLNCALYGFDFGACL